MLSLISQCCPSKLIKTSAAPTLRDAVALTLQNASQRPHVVADHLVDPSAPLQHQHVRVDLQLGQPQVL